jgi:hypothetical protein
MIKGQFATVSPGANSLRCVRRRVDVQGTFEITFAQSLCLCRFALMAGWKRNRSVTITHLKNRITLVAKVGVELPKPITDQQVAETPSFPEDQKRGKSN